MADGIHLERQLPSWRRLPDLELRYPGLLAELVTWAAEGRVAISRLGSMLLVDETALLACLTPLDTDTAAAFLTEWTPRMPVTDSTMTLTAAAARLGLGPATVRERLRVLGLNPQRTGSGKRAEYHVTQEMIDMILLCPARADTRASFEAGMAAIGRPIRKPHPSTRRNP